MVFGASGGFPGLKGRVGGGELVADFLGFAPKLKQPIFVYGLAGVKGKGVKEGRKGRNPVNRFYAVKWPL